jgi:uncharacterized BrkB/YihY/UPF0761 family membrane protein
MKVNSKQSNGRTGRGKVAAMALTALAWAVAVAFHALRYVSTHVNLADNEGYEKLWDWQLFFWAFGRLPYLIALLVLLLWLEWKFWPARRTVQK